MRDINEEIHLEAYNPEWPVWFDKEQAVIKKRTGDYPDCTYIEHIGSTSVSGMIAKPIIDILIGTIVFPPDDLFIASIIKLGYEYMKTGSTPERLYFIRRDKVSYNIQVVKYGSEIWRKDILFRDYLRVHPEIAKDYSALKEEIYRSGTRTLLKYSSRKAGFISAMIENF